MNHSPSIRTLLLILFSLAFSFAMAQPPGQDTLSYGRVLTLMEQDSFKEAFDILKELDGRVYDQATIKGYVRFLLKVVYQLDKRGSYEPGLTYCFKVLELCDDNPELVREKTECLLEMSSDYYFLGVPSLSLKYANLAGQVAVQYGLRKQYAESVNKKGLYYERIGQLDSAIIQFTRGLDLRKEINDLHGQSSTLANLGLVHERLGHLEEALTLQRESLTIDESIGQPLGVAWSHQMLGELNTRMGRYEEASTHLDLAETEGLRQKSGELLLQTYLDKKNLLEKLQRFEEALTYANKYETLRDSIHNRSISGRTALLQSNFELNQNAQKISAQQATLNWQRNFILLGIVLSFIISVMASFYFRSYQRSKYLNREIIEQNEEIRQQSESLSRTNEALSKLNLELAEKKEEIQAQAEELSESHDTIVKINEHLEEMVESRTNELAKAYKELDTFFYRASHDFRRPLTTFMGLSEVAKITLKEPYALELFSKVRQTADNLDKMLIKLQSVSDVGLQQLSYKEVSSEDLVGMILTSYGEELRNTEVNIKTDIRLAAFPTYPTIIKVILENLVENAIQFRGPVNPYVKLSIFQRDGKVILEVADNGQGIDEEYQASIFNMYFRGSESSKGNGLGLYIVRKAVEKLNGRIEFESILHQGSTFRVHLPGEKATKT